MRVCVKRSYSDWCLVTSSVPQDDTKMWSRIQDMNDNLKLQEDLNKLCEWSDKWMLKFNMKKCKVLHVGSRNNKFGYQMKEGDGSRVLEEMVLEKDLGVLISYDLKVEQQCDKAVKKATTVFGMIKRSFKNLDEESLRTLYCA